MSDVQNFFVRCYFLLLFILLITCSYSYCTFKVLNSLENDVPSILTLNINKITFLFTVNFIVHDTHYNFFIQTLILYFWVTQFWCPVLFATLIVCMFTLTCSKSWNLIGANIYKCNMVRCEISQFISQLITCWLRL